MSDQQDKQQLGQDVAMVLSLHNLAAWKTFQVIDAPTPASAYSYALKWTGNGSTNCDIQAVITDNELRANMNKTDEPPFVIPDDIDSKLEDGETLFLLSWEK